MVRAAKAVKSPRGAVLVLGASRGIGRACALALAQAGFAVGTACRRAVDAQTVAAAIAEAGGRALPLAVDVGRAFEVEAAVQALQDRFGALAGLVNNAAAIDPIGRLADTDPEAWARLIEINLVGAYHGLRYVLPVLREGGVVVNLSSGAAASPMEGWSAYCASKAGLAMLTRMVHHEYASAGILVYGFRPGVVDTDMQASIRASGLNPVSRLERQALADVAVPAAAITWLFTARPADLAGQEVDIREPALCDRISRDRISGGHATRGR